MSEIKKANDMFDREVRVGDICVYPVRRGSRMWMNKVVVKSVVADELGIPIIVGIKQDGYPVRIKALGRVAIIGRDGMVPFVEAEGGA